MRADLSLWQLSEKPIIVSGKHTHAYNQDQVTNLVTVAIQCKRCQYKNLSTSFKRQADLAGRNTPTNCGIESCPIPGISDSGWRELPRGCGV
jgi:hypothetical protein